MSSILLAWSNLNNDRMFSNYGVEWAVFDEGCVARFNLSARLDSKGFDYSTHFLFKGLADNSTWQVNRKDFR